MLIKNKNRYSFIPETVHKEHDIQLQEEAKIIEEMKSNSDESTPEATNDYFQTFEEEIDVGTSINNRSIRNNDYSQRYYRQIRSIKNILILSTIFALTNFIDFIPNMKLFSFSALPYISIFFSLLFLLILNKDIKKNINEMALFADPNTVKFVREKTNTYSFLSIMLSLVLATEVFLFIWKYNLHSLFVVFGIVYFAIIFIIINKMFQERQRHLTYAQQKTTYL